jgi:hypothetical protein
MTQVTTDETANGHAAAPSPYTERLVVRVRRDTKDRLGMQATLEGCAPAHLLDRLLDVGLMTYDQIADATRQRGSGERSNGNGSH